MFYPTDEKDVQNPVQVALLLLSVSVLFGGAKETALDQSR